MSLKKTLMGLAALTMLGACGDTLGEQLVLGGAAGTGGAMVADGDLLTGAVIGAAANVAYCRRHPEAC